MSTNDDDFIVGDADTFGVRSEEGERFDYYLGGPDRGEFGFDAADIDDIRDMLDRMRGDG